MHDETLVQRALRLLSQPIEPVKATEVVRQQRSMDLVRQDPTMQLGALITWTRGDGSVQQGVVDTVHVDDTGARWAFVTLGESWAVVNLKFVKGVSL